MRRPMIWAFVANLALQLISLRILPAVVAIHFGGAGWPDAWASKWINALLVMLIEATVFAVILSAPRLSLSIPVKWGTLSYRQCCPTPEDRAELEARFAHLMYEFGLALFVFLFLVGVLTLAANLSEPVRLNEPLMLAGSAGYLLYVAYWVVKLVRQLKAVR
jgi:uncharacterized membrane protein